MKCGFIGFYGPQSSTAGHSCRKTAMIVKYPILRVDVQRVPCYCVERAVNLQCWAMHKLHSVQISGLAYWSVNAYSFGIWWNNIKGCSSPRFSPVQDKACGASATAAKGSAGKRYNESASREYTDGGHGGKRTQSCVHVTGVTLAF